MGAYNSRAFSRDFSKRTESNLDYIYKTVNSDENVKKSKEDFEKQFDEAISIVQELVDDIRKEARYITTVQKKGKNELKSKLFSVANKLEQGKREFNNSIKEISSNGNIENGNLYEVTQLLNSLMGIAVLPYEMHKEYFKYIGDSEKSEENRGKSLAEIQKDVKKSNEYENLKVFILKLYREKKWKTTYGKDLKNGVIKEDTIVFRFLRHLRNATCHSGDNAISILPLTDGKVIEKVLFYDHYGEDNGEDNGEEFGMCLTIEELRDLVKYVARFYQDTEIGFIDKTSAIIKAEEKVAMLLGRKVL